MQGAQKKAKAAGGEEGEEEEAAAEDDATPPAEGGGEGGGAEEEEVLDEEGNAVLDDEGNPVKRRKVPPVDPQALTAEELELQSALLVEESESCEEGEAWSKHCTWQLPIFVKDGALMHVQVQTTTVQPLVVGLLKQKKLVASVSKDGTEALPIVDFGKLPVGQERVVDITLTNCAELPALARETDVTPVALDPFGPFSILKFPTKLIPSQSQTISLSFQPRREAAFKERLVLRSGRNCVRYLLVGHGVSPVFVTKGLTDSSELNGEGRIDIGDVLQVKKEE